MLFVFNFRDYGIGNNLPNCDSFDAVERLGDLRLSYNVLEVVINFDSGR